MIAQGIGSRLPGHCYACNSPRTWRIAVNGVGGKKDADQVHACPFHLGDAVEKFHAVSGKNQLLLTLSPSPK